MPVWCRGANKCAPPACARRTEVPSIDSSGSDEQELPQQAWVTLSAHIEVMSFAAERPLLLHLDLIDAKEEDTSRTLRASVRFSDAYVDGLVREVLSEAGWSTPGDDGETAGRSELHWGEFGRLAWDEVLEGRGVGSAYYLKAGLVRKADLHHYLTKYARREPAAGVLSNVPTTHVGDLEDEADLDEFVTGWAEAAASERTGGESDGAGAAAGLWVLKPSDANCGEGIAVLHAADAEGARRGIARHPHHQRWLLQRYVPPLLLPPPSPPSSSPAVAAAAVAAAAHKFHLRVHVLAAGAISVWVHDEPLLLMASEPWSRPPPNPPSADRGDGDGTLLCHLTNHARQVHGAAYREERHTSTLREMLGDEAARGIMAEVRRVATGVFAAYARSSAAFFALPGCFELFGVDFAVDPQHKPWLLEVNSGPDLALFGARLRPLGRTMLSDVLRVLDATSVLEAAAPRPPLAAPPKEGSVVGAFRCVLVRPCADAGAELARFKRLMAIAGRFAHSLHETTGAPVRGTQARILKEG